MGGNGCRNIGLCANGACRFGRVGEPKVLDGLSLVLLHLQYVYRYTGSLRHIVDPYVREPDNKSYVAVHIVGQEVVGGYRLSVDVKTPQ